MVKQGKDYVIGDFVLRHVSGKTMVRKKESGPERSLVPTGELYADETVKQIICELVEEIEELKKQVRNLNGFFELIYQSKGA